MLAAGAPSAVYNLGNGNGYSVLEVIRAAEAVTGRPIPHRYAPRRLGDPPALVAGSAKIKRELGWRPRFESLQAMLETAWRWHSSHPRGGFRIEMISGKRIIVFALLQVFCLLAAPPGKQASSEGEAPGATNPEERLEALARQAELAREGRRTGCRTAGLGR